MQDSAQAFQVQTSVYRTPRLPDGFRDAGFRPVSVGESTERPEDFAPANAPSPLPPDADFQAKLKSLGIEVRNPGGTKALLMVVDDEPPVLALSSIMLSEAGYRVLAFENPKSALLAYRVLHPYITLVLLDFSMPELDGEQLYTELKAANPHVRALLVSGYADHEKITRMKQKGLDGYLGKPFTPESLLQKVAGLV